ncbi:hypothetical protein TSUD_119460 [Trifolium subterraneum]|uniref:NB-ARC domain-containing protein n=1 Tax=Trifolium subterraneum TaxID=3900 RepID=A0A2Z6NQV9_TRISU|nr:hypothetical protein TSUD_119460 [Trifolium subterraneum]
MAATLVGGAFLSATVKTMIDKLISTEFRDYINNKKLNVSLLKQLQTTLLILQAVLDDAEEKQINNPAVKQWLDDLKDAIFDAEDLLNEISYDSLRCKVENTEAANKTNQVSARVFHRTPSTSVVNESVMVGRKDDKETIMNMLLSDSGTSNNKIGVVAILGMGGVGKTTLAQLVYNDKEVQEHFDLKAWACVSEDFNTLRVTKSLLESITSRAWDSNNLDILRVELRKNLMGKRFLFVLDDLWNDNYNDWDELVTPLINEEAGSRVIITTRQQKVADVAITNPICKFEPLSAEDCWSLLSKHAFGSEDFCGGKYRDLEAIGRKISRKCGGLPIAAKTCKSLESIFISETSSHHPSMLQKLSLIRCEALISLPRRMETLTTLEQLSISHCDALRSLPGLDTLTSLKRLSLGGPQELMLSFSEGPCLPSNLQSIYIESTRITMPRMTEWGLQRLNTL